MKFALLLGWLVMSSLVCEAAGGRALVRLRERAGVAEGAIRLSDLLPPDAPAPLAREAAAVSLGRSPQLGSRRVFLRDEIAHAFAAHPDLLQQLSIPERVTVERQGWQISADLVLQSVAKFLSRDGANVSAGGIRNLRLLSAPSALGPNPQMEVEAVRWDPAQRQAEFAIGCVERKACGRFLAVAEVPANFVLDWGVGPGRRVRDRTSQPVLVRAGKALMLDLDDGRIHIALRVICLQAGSLGQTIRVREAGGRHIYRAQVTSHGALRGRL